MRFKQGEEKTIKFTLTDSSGHRVDLTGSSFTFDVARDKPHNKVVIQRPHATFDETSVATGEVMVTLFATDTDQIAGKYTGEIRITLASGAIHKSTDIVIEIENAITSAIAS